MLWVVHNCLWTCFGLFEGGVPNTPFEILPIKNIPFPFEKKNKFCFRLKIKINETLSLISMVYVEFKLTYC